MTPRRRSSKKAGWPDNLYEVNGYYSWKHPGTGKHLGIGRVSRAEAFAQAAEANAHVASLAPETRLVHRITIGHEHSVKAWSTKFEQILAERKLASNTRMMYAAWLRRFRKEFGDETVLSSIQPITIAEKLESIEKVTPRTAQQLRGFWNDCFREAKLRGWIKENPVLDTRTRPHTVKRSRLTLEVFLKVYRGTKTPWLQKAMALALVSGQRRENVMGAKVIEVREGHWWVNQGKTGARVAIPLEIRLDEFGMSLGEVIKSCRGTGVLSPYLIHHTTARGRSKAGGRVSLRRVTDAFTKEIASLGIDWGDKTPPTFHEIRSLSERLYKRQGNVDTQDLLGHKSAQTTELYDDVRGAEWVHVKLGAAQK